MLRLPRAALAAVPLAGVLDHRREPSQCEGATTFLCGSVLGLAVGFAAGRSLEEIGEVFGDKLALRAPLTGGAARTSYGTTGTAQGVIA